MKKILVLCMSVAAVLLSAVILYFLFGVYVLLTPHREYAMEVASPSGEWVATVYEINGGATTGYAYEVDLHCSKFPSLTSKKVAAFYDASRGQDGAPGVVPVWTSNSTLEIKHLSAKEIEVFSPYSPWLCSDVIVFAGH